MRNEPQPDPVVEPVRRVVGILYTGNSDFAVVCFGGFSVACTFVQARRCLTTGSDLAMTEVHRTTLPPCECAGYLIVQVVSLIAMPVV